MGHNARLQHPLSAIEIVTMAQNKSKRAYVVRSSGIHGRGVFATRTIRKNARILEYRGTRTTWEIAAEQPDSDPDDPFHTFLFELSDGRVIDAAEGGNAARWINHSCDPNCETIEEGDRVFIHAVRTIRAGEELTYDYQLVVDEPITRRLRKSYACGCGAEECRGTMLQKG
jgi:SET domain-containing protein